MYLLLLICSLSLTGLVRRYALSRNVMDVPNERSSHVTPTPRGGGVAIVLCSLVAMLWPAASQSSFLYVVFAGVVVAGVGLFDDHGHVSARWRLLFHFIGAALVLYAFGGLPAFYLLGLNVDLGVIGNILAAVGIVWLLNLFNFMDGIDGIAAIEVITTTLLGGILLISLGQNSELVTVHFILAAGALGFLAWNFPPAKIFMGDAGSGFLGLMLGALAIGSAHLAPQMLWTWLILLGVFIVDATFTLLRRLLSGERVYEAHRSHAYQHAASRFGHKKVSLSVLLINVIWLGPWSYLASQRIIDGALALILAYIPLVGLAIYFKAGQKD